MRFHLPAFALLGALCTFGPCVSPAQDQASGIADVRVSTAVSAKPLLTSVARGIMRQNGVQVAVSSNHTNAENLDDLAKGTADLAFITKPLTGEDRAAYPDLDLVSTPVGVQVVAIAVSDDVWDAGVHTITQKSMLGIYEKTITNWKDLGGPDEPITLFSFAEGGGIWEIFTEWLYGDNRKAPVPTVEKVASSMDARDDLEFSSGSIAPMGAGLVDGSRCHALGVDLSPQIVHPTPDEVAAGSYPLVRPMIAVTNGRPTNAKRVVTDYLTSAEGQKLIRSNGALGLEAVPKPPPVSPYY